MQTQNHCLLPTHYTNPEESSTTKVSKHAACGCYLFTHYSSDSSKAKRNFYKVTNCVKKLCTFLRKQLQK